MKPRHLIIFVGLFVILLMLGVSLRRGSGGRDTLEGQVKLVRLFDSDFTVEGVSGVTISGVLSLPEKDEEAEPARREMVLARDESGSWMVRAEKDVPADSQKADALLTGLENLSGDLRAENRASHAGLGVAGENSLSIEIKYGRGNAAKSQVLHIGERPIGDTDATYVRREGENQVYRVEGNIRQMAGFDRSSVSAPERRYWLDLSIASFDYDDMERIVLDYPSKRMVFVKEKSAADMEDNQETAETEWRLEEGGEQEKFLSYRVDNLAYSLAALTAMDMAEAEDAAEAQESGDKYAVAIEIAGRDALFTLTLYKTATAWFVESSLRPGLLYALEPTATERIFPPAEDFFQEEEEAVE